MAPCFVAGVTTAPPSVINAVRLGFGSPNPGAGPLPARVGIAEAAVARDPLLHAHLQGSHAAILVHGPSADIRQCAPGTLVGLACRRAEGHGRCHGSRDEDDSHGGLRGCGPGPSSSDRLVKGIYCLATARGHGHFGRLHRLRLPGSRPPALLPKRHNGVHLELRSGYPLADTALPARSLNPGARDCAGWRTPDRQWPQMRVEAMDAA